ncbi:MAG: Nitroreductase family protein, partial [uncultured Quadrisphaera sp.]
MELRDVVRGRRMVRAYDPGAPVPDAVVQRLVDAATRAPSAGNAQGLDLVVLRTADDRERFWSAAAGPGATRAPGSGADHWLAGMRTAPLLLVVLTDPGAYARRYAAPDKARAAAEQEAAGGGPVPWWDVDAGMAAVLVLLTAVDEGLGACFFGVPPGRHGAVRVALGAPQDRRLVG